MPNQPGQPGGHQPGGHLPDGHLPVDGSGVGPGGLGWEDNDAPWGGVDLSSKDFAPLFTVGDSFYILGYDSAGPLNFLLERRAIISGRGKYIQGHAIWPEIVGPTGYTLKVSMGSHNTPEGGILWEGPYDFTIGTHEFVDFAVTGRYLAIKFESVAVPVWKLQSIDIDYSFVGNH